MEITRNRIKSKCDALIRKLSDLCSYLLVHSSPFAMLSRNSSVCFARSKKQLWRSSLMVRAWYIHSIGRDLQPKLCAPTCFKNHSSTLESLPTETFYIWPDQSHKHLDFSILWLNFASVFFMWRPGLHASIYSIIVMHVSLTIYIESVYCYIII